MINKAIKILKKNGYDIEDSMGNEITLLINKVYDKSIKENIIRVLSKEGIFFDLYNERVDFDYEGGFLKTISLIKF